jgi:hypothetical protein
MEKSMRSIFIVILAVTLPVAAQEPAWLTEARAREAKEMKPVKLKSEDGKFHATVAAKLQTKKIEEVEGSYTLTFDIGAPNPLDCELYLDGIDVGTQLREVPSNTFSYLEQSQGKIEAKAIESTDAGVIGEWPFLAANWIYRVKDGEDLRVGALQHVVAEKGDVSISCQFVALGYSKTIHRVMTSLLNSLQFVDAEPSPYFTETAVVEIAGKPVGVSRVEMTRDSDGDTQMNNELAMLVVMPDGSPSSQDTISVQWIRPDGELINAVHVEVENGELSTDLRLVMKENAWHVTGTFKNKEFSAQISGDQEPESPIGQAYALKKRLAATGAIGSQLQSMRWTPSADPSRFLKTTTTISKDLGNGHFAVLDSLAGMNIDYVAEAATGNAVSATVSMGPAEMKMRSVHKSGSF